MKCFPARFLAVAIVAAACAHAAAPADITRDRAIAVARTHIKFEPTTVNAVRAALPDRRKVWRVTFRGRLPGQPPGLFETVVVEIDRRSGEVVSVAKT